MTGTHPTPVSGAPLFASLELIDDQTPKDAALNMATDEALLAGLADTALLRLYRWQRPAVSFGYFDPAGPVSLAYPGHDLVRRWTGGGVVEHGEDFTYSLLVPRTQPLTALRAEESYRLVHRMVAAALAAAAPDLPALGEFRPGTASPPASRVCFANAVPYDLLLHGEKIAGAAQRRTRHGWLHQGSVRLRGEAAGIYGRLGATLPAALGANLVRRGLRPGEADTATRLARTKYGTPEWLHRF